jgi:drug/metabolite transporter (DMT)-like permease
VGFCMEYLLTAGLGSDDSPSATVMIYSQVIWALLLDWLIWRLHVNSLSILGCIGLISTLTITTLIYKAEGPKRADIHDGESEFDEIESELADRRDWRYALD